MASSVLKISGLASSLFKETALGNSATAIASGSSSVSMIDIDNSANGAATYVKFYNVAAGSVVVGTTAPDLVIMVPASTRISMSFFSGLTFGTALSACAVTTGGTAGTTAPTNAVVVQVAFT